MEYLRIYKKDMDTIAFENLTFLENAIKGEDKKGEFVKFITINEKLEKALERPLVRIPISEYDVETVFHDLVHGILDKEVHWSFPMEDTDLNVNLVFHKEK